MENVPLPPGVPSPNLLLAAGTAFIPLLMGFIWYHPKVFGKAWMVGAVVTEADAKKMNMPLVFGLTYVLSFILSVKFNLMTVHQFSLLSFLQPEMNFTNPPGFDEALRTFAPLAEHKFRTFRHGAVTALIDGVILFLPIIGINGLFERRGWKYILINTGFWTLCMAIMGGILCQWA